MKHKLLFITFLACFNGWGQVSITSTGSSYTQNFDGLPSTGTGISQTGGIFSSGWSFLEGGTNANGTLETGTGSSNSGNTYSFGIAGINALSDRAFGILQSGNLTSILGFKFTNNTGSTITSIVIGYTGEVWRLSTASDSFAFSYQTGNVMLNVGSGWTTIAGLAFTTPVTGTAGPVDGNATVNRSVIAPLTIAGLSISNGTTVTLRWVDTTGSSSAGFGIDDFSITLIGAPPSTTYTTSWSNSAPTASIDAIIDGDLTTTADFACKDLTINSGKTLTIAAGNKLTVSGNLINNGSIVFKSNATATAVFGVFTGTQTGSGTVTTERYIPAKRAYRFLSPSVTTSTSIRANWQENAGTSAGLGTHITGTGGATNGFDPTETNNSSLLRFINGAWVGATSTNVSLTAGNAYCIMVRGDRTTDLTTNTPTASSTVLRATGTLFTGNFSPVLSAAAGGYSFVGNPYQAPLDIKTALQSSTDINKNAVYYWDPNINSRGGYITRNLQTSQNIPTSFVNDFVQPGQAFFVVNEPTLTSTPALTFTENHKSVANSTAGVFRNSNTNEYGTLRVNLQANTNNQWQTIEGTLAVFNPSFSWEVNADDATKMSNLDEEVSFVQNNTNLAITLQNNPSATSELPIKIEKMRHTNYQWQFELNNYDGATPYLFDTLNNSYTQINNATVVPFTADSNTTNRFKIVFQNALLGTASFQNALAIYPNPSKSGASFYIDGISEATVTVSNLLGQTIPVQTKSQGTTLQVTPNTNLSQGVYLVNITAQGSTQQVKWIVE